MGNWFGTAWPAGWCEFLHWKQGVGGGFRNEFVADSHTFFAIGQAGDFQYTHKVRLSSEQVGRRQVPPLYHCHGPQIAFGGHHFHATGRGEAVPFLTSDRHDKSAPPTSEINGAAFPVF